MGTPNFLHFILIFIITYTFPKACTFSVFLFLNGCTRGIWKFLGQGLNPKCSCTTTAVAMSMSDPLTHCARPGIEPLSPKLPEPPMVRFFFFLVRAAAAVAVCTFSLWKFPGQWLNQSCSCWPQPQPDLSCV